MPFDFGNWWKVCTLTTGMASMYPVSLNLSHWLFPSLQQSTKWSVFLWWTTFFIYFRVLSYLSVAIRRRFGLLKNNAPRRRLSKRDIAVANGLTIVSLLGRTCALFFGCSDRASKPWLRVNLSEIPFSINLGVNIDFAFKVLAYVVVMDGIFYTMHRLEHGNRWLYKHVHSKHHDMHLPTTVSAFHDSIPEKLFNAFVQVYLSACIVPMNFMFLHYALYGIFISEIWGHSGVSLHLTPPYTPLLDLFDVNISVECHDLHHRVTKSNFGKQTMLYDKIFGTFLAPYETGFNVNLEQAKIRKEDMDMEPEPTKPVTQKSTVLNSTSSAADACKPATAVPACPVA